MGELIGYPCSSVRPLYIVHIFKHEYLCNQWADHNELFQKHHWDGGKAALCLGPDWIKTLVSMAIDSSHRVIMECLKNPNRLIMGKMVLPRFLGCS